MVEYEYNPWNQLTKFTDASNNITTYGYDGTGMRTSKTQNGKTTKFYWDRGFISNEATNDVITANNYIGNQGIFARQSDCQMNYMFKNGHGDVTALVRNGITTKTYDYDAYGTEKNINKNDSNPFRYCGEYFDNETGNIYLRNRYYDTNVGRFITEDPIRDGMNWFVYCGNNPIVFVDPSGLEYLVVSGSEYDNDRYKYNFIEPAIKKLKELKELNDGEWITWIVSKTGYSDEALQRMNDIAYDLGVGFVMIESGAQLQNYINSQDTSQWALSEKRQNDTIKKFALFSHGLTNSVELGYSQSNAKSLSLDSNWIGGVDSRAFDNPNSAFYSCNTGTGGSSSFAQKWVNTVGGRTWAVADGKTNYAQINSGEWALSSTWWDWKCNGFRGSGSKYYPVAGQSPAYFTNFYRQ